MLATPKDLVPIVYLYSLWISGKCCTMVLGDSWMDEPLDPSSNVVLSNCHSTSLLLNPSPCSNVFPHLITLGGVKSLSEGAREKRVFNFLFCLTLALLCDRQCFATFVEWVGKNLRFNIVSIHPIQSNAISLNEKTTIRVLGGLLSAHLIAFDYATLDVVDRNLL
ncbi:hypothetical protein V8G54_013220 [Vigna mungo]|uniref:Uncharacterized protein n=1 Tax=Vigna mungo TaxID=3915 RepID=A0AAQ3S1B7_VIGMU